MAISVDYSTASPWLITIPQSDLTLESGTKYTLTVDEFWILLRDFTDNEVNVPKPKLYSRIPATPSTPSITNIEDDYELEFEDGSYSVNIIEGNTNIREVEVKNTVSVNTNNTTGYSIVETGVSGLTAAESAALTAIETFAQELHEFRGLDSSNPAAITGDGVTTSVITVNGKVLTITPSSLTRT